MTSVHPRRAFTLVEMLVVTAVIVALLAIILPAVQNARESARRATCLSNERQIVISIVTHEAKKGYIPGWRNKLVCTTSGTIFPTWPPLVLPYLDRSDLYTAITSSGTTTVGNTTSPVWTTGSARLITAIAATGTTAQTQVFMSVFDCPSNPVADRSTATTLDNWNRTAGINVSMAYAGNGGTGNNVNQFDGVMADTTSGTSGRMTLGQIAVAKGLAGTLLLAEKVGRGDPVRTPWVAESGTVTTGTFSWNGETLATGSGGGCIFGLGSYSGTGTVVNPSTPTNWQIAALHPGGVVTGYCDGRTDFLDESIDSKTFFQLLTSSTDTTKLSDKMQNRVK